MPDGWGRANECDVNGGHSRYDTASEHDFHSDATSESDADADAVPRLNRQCDPERRDSAASVSTTSAAGGDDTTDDDSDASLGLAPPPDLRAEWASVLPAAAALPNPRPATAPAAMARQHATPVAKPAWMDEGDAGASSAKAVTAKPKSASIWCDCRRCVAPPPGHAAEAVVPNGSALIFAGTRTT